MKNYWKIKPMKVKQPTYFKPMNVDFTPFSKTKGLPPFGDHDKDNVPNWRDCRPFDRRYQDEEESWQEIAAKTPIGEMQHKIAHEGSPELKMLLSKNPNLEPHIIGLLYNDPIGKISQSTRINQAKRFQLPQITRTPWYDFDAIEAQIDCKSDTTPEVLAGVLEKEKAWMDDVVSIINYNANHKSISQEYGYLEAPIKISWKIRTTEMSRYIQTAKKGRDIKRGLNSLEPGKRNQDVRFVTDPGLQNEKMYNQWYDVYEQTMTSKPRGRIIASRDRQKMASSHFGLYAFKGNKFLGGRIIKEFDQGLSASYQALPRDPKYLNEIAYAKMMEEAIRRNKTTVSLGIDTNFYGYHMATGLYKSKAAFGFKARPYTMKGNHLFKINRFDKFESPCMFLSYMVGPHSKLLINNIFIRGNTQINSKDYPASGGTKVWRV